MPEGHLARWQDLTVIAINLGVMVAIGVYWAIAIAYSLSAVIGILLFRRGRWKEKEV